MDQNQVEQIAQSVYDKNSGSKQYTVSPIAMHVHNGVDSPRIKASDLVGGSSSFSHVRATSASSQSIPNGSETDIVFEIVEYDTLTEYNKTTGIFTPKSEGYYNLSFSTAPAGIYTWAAGNVWSTRVKKNGTFYCTSFLVVETTVTSPILASIVTTTVHLNAGETLNCAVIQTQGGSVNLYAGGAVSFMSIDGLSQ